MKLFRGETLLISDLEIANNLWTRGRGLLGRTGLKKDQALWIDPGNSIHTWFMKFSIDCVFVTKELQVVSVVEQISPWRWVGPQWGARSVIEMAAGTAAHWNLKKGDRLHVGT